MIDQIYVTELQDMNNRILHSFDVADFNQHLHDMRSRRYMENKVKSLTNYVSTSLT